MILWDGSLIGYLSRTRQNLMTFLPESDSEKAAAVQQLVNALAKLAKPGQSLLLTKIDGAIPSRSSIEADLKSVGFMGTSQGYLHTGRH